MSILPISRAACPPNASLVISRRGGRRLWPTISVIGRPSVLVPYAAAGGKPSGGKCPYAWAAWMRPWSFSESQFTRARPDETLYSILTNPQAAAADGPSRAGRGAARIHRSADRLGRSACPKGTPMSPATKLAHRYWPDPFFIGIRRYRHVGALQRF